MVALDIDDVLAGFYPAICKYMSIPEKKVDIWDGKGECRWIVDAMYIIKDDPFFWNSLKVLSSPNSIDFELNCYITSSPEHLLEIRTHWLYDLGFLIKPVFSTQDKVQLMIDRDIKILVDDKLSTVNKVNEAGMIGLQFKPPYMSAEIEDKSKIITHLSEVNKFL